MFIYHLTALFLFGVLVIESAYENRSLRVPGVAWLLLALAGTYGFSILVHGSNHNITRILAAINNLSYWLMGWMLIIVLASRFRMRHVPGVLRVFPVLGVFSILILIFSASIASQGAVDLSFPTPLHPLVDVFGRTALVEYSFNVRLISDDYLAGMVVPRFNLYGPYPTAAGAFFLVSLPMLVAWGYCNGKLRKPWFWLLVLGNVVGLGMTLARMAVLALIAGLAFVVIAQRRHVAIWGAAVVAAGILAAPFLWDTAAHVIAAREGSSLSRFSLYQESVQRLDDVEWLVGRGVRSYSDEQRMPLGSHSTYVSLLYRTGSIGLVLFLILQAAVLARWYGLKKYLGADKYLTGYWQAMGVVLVGMMCWMLTEDIDVPQLLAFLYFGAIGTLEGIRRSVIEQHQNPSPLDSTPMSGDGTRRPSFDHPAGD